MTPISLALRVPPAAQFSPVREALALIDRVHGDGELPSIPVVLIRSNRESGGYRFTDRGTALGIRLSQTSDQPQLSIIHEVGHFLDHQTLGERGIWASASGRLGPVMNVINESQAVRRLTSLNRQRMVLIDGPRGRRVSVPIDHGQVAYYLDPRELFARAYAQWVTEFGTDPRISAQLDRLRNPQSSVGMYHFQWSDEDFKPIAAAMSELFRRKGWR